MPMHLLADRGMGHQTARNPNWRFLGECLAWVGAAAYVLYAFSLTGREVYSEDSFAYAEVAQRMLQGDRLYVDIWLDKPPFAILFYAVPQLIAPGSSVGLQVWLGVWVLLEGLLAIVAVGARSTGWLQRSAVVACLLLLPFAGRPFIWASTSHHANLFVVWVLFVSYRLVTSGAVSLWALAASGCCLTIMFNIRQNTLIYSAVPVMAILLTPAQRKETVTRFAALALGAAAGWVAVLLIVWRTTTVQDYVDTVFLYPRRYAAAEGWSQGLENVVTLLMSAAKEPLVAMTALVALLGLARGCPHSFRVRLFLSCVLLVGVVHCVLPLKPYSHYWTGLIPVTALFVFHGVAGDDGTFRRLRLIVCGILFLVLAVQSVALSNEARNARSVTTLNTVAAAVDRVTGPGDTLLVVDSRFSNASYLCFATKARPANRVFFCVQLGGYWCTILPQGIDQVEAEYYRDPPTIITVRGELIRNASENGVDLDLCRTKVAVRLLKKYKYTLMETVEQFDIYKRLGE